MEGGGDFLVEVRNLAIPFGVYLAGRGIQMMIDKHDVLNKQKKSKKQKKTKKIIQKGGEGCGACSAMAPPLAHAAYSGGGINATRNANILGLQNELNRLSNQLQDILMY
jgi:hypothetical protein